MKRLVLTTTGTVAGLAALLSFKTHADPADAGPLPSLAAPTTAHGSTAGTGAKQVTGPAVTTRYGVVQVRATVAHGRIEDVSFVQLRSDDAHSRQIDSAAGPVLLRETIDGQTAQVDTVSGASYTSAGYRRSLQAALDQAGVR